MKKALIFLLALASVVAYAGENDDKLLEALVLSQDGKIALVSDSNQKIEIIGDLKCHSIGSLLCNLGTCTARVQYSNQVAPGEAFVAINVSLQDETCEAHEYTAVELISWD